MSINGLRLPWVGRGKAKESPEADETARVVPAEQKRSSRRITERMLAVMLGLAITVVPVSALIAYAAWYAQDQKVPREITQTYWFDQQNERWVNVVQEKKLAQNEDGSWPSESHTIIINVNENNPIKQIVIQEALVINPSSTDPLLEINGNPSNISGNSTGPRINIGTLTIKDVDAKRMEIDVDVVRVDMENVVAQDNELHLELNAVNVVRTARGAASSLFFGVGRGAIVERASLSAGLGEKFNVSSRETGLRADRIRILGPSSSVSTAFIESLVIERSSVLGKIYVANVGVQDLVLKQISLDDS